MEDVQSNITMGLISDPALINLQTYWNTKQFIWNVLTRCSTNLKMKRDEDSFTLQEPNIEEALEYSDVSDILW